MSSEVRKIKPEAVVNTSGFHPLGVAVLVEPYEPEVKKSIIALPPSVSERTTMVESRARVVEIGPCAWHDEPSPRAKPGDLVYITKFAGWMGISQKDGKVYRLINDRDIFCSIEEGV